MLRGVRAAVAAGLDPVKVNAVPMRATLHGAPDLLAWALAEGVQLRFIEEMPLDADNTWSRVEMVTAQEVLDSLSTRYELIPAGRDDPSAPAELWEVAGHFVDGRPATVGVIATVTRNFCAACDHPGSPPRGRSARACPATTRRTSSGSAGLPGLRDRRRLARGDVGNRPGHRIGGTAFHRPNGRWGRWRMTCRRR